MYIHSDRYSNLLNSGLGDEEIRAKLADYRRAVCATPELLAPSVKALRSSHDPTITDPDFVDIYSRDVLQDAVDFVHQAGSYDKTVYSAVPAAGTATITTTGVVNLALGFAVRFEGSADNWTPFEANFTTTDCLLFGSTRPANRNVTFELGKSDNGRWFYVPFGTFDAGSSKNGRPKVCNWTSLAPGAVVVNGIPAGVTVVKARVLAAGTIALDEFCLAYGLEIRLCPPSRRHSLRWSAAPTHGFAA